MYSKKAKTKFPKQCKRSKGRPLKIQEKANSCPKAIKKGIEQSVPKSIPYTPERMAKNQPFRILLNGRTINTSIAQT